eukprot:gb/GEZN01002115.1/.p1 GENE.gb/GEZN01002115.1/~~gb/GEZN01002115.1/.p1  ORF type:complete len:796 (-),score=107.06 gb/GEZN01002115.1/:249-2603(-)
MADNEKHVMLSYGPAHRQLVLAVAAALRQRKIPTYVVSNRGSVNQAMAEGVERAAVFIPLVAEDYQNSRKCSKEFNYADQRKLPMRPIMVQNGFKPTSWLGAVLALYVSKLPEIQITSPNLEADIVDLLIKSITTIWHGAIQPGRKDLSPRPPVSTASNILYPGGAVSGWYSQPDGDRFDMHLEFFTMENHVIRGQGDDGIGAFTVMGSYDTSRKTAHFIKQYVGAHKLNYAGSYARQENGDIEMAGMWDVVPADGSWRGPFEFSLKRRDVSQELTKIGTRVVLVNAAPEQKLARLVADELKKKGVDVWHGEASDAPVDTAAIIVPFMSQALQKSALCQKLLETADERGCEFVPIMAQEGFQQGGWLGILMGGLLWEDFRPSYGLRNMEQLCTELKNKVPFVFGATSAEVFSGKGNMTGWFEQDDKKYPMQIESFHISHGTIEGSGRDDLGTFFTKGKYDDQLHFSFIKQYHGQQAVHYSGEMSYDSHLIVLGGKWWIGETLSTGPFELLMASQPTSNEVKHMMISYQWKNQSLAHKLYDLLKAKGIPLWFDIEGDMKGNINSAMADGVEHAAVICCIATSEYQKSPNCAKELVYAQQRGIHILPCTFEPSFRPADWLANCLKQKPIILDPKTLGLHVDKLCEEVAKVWNYATFKSGPEKLVGTFSKLSMKESQEDVMFPGGSVAGFYSQPDGVRSEMEFAYLTLRSGRVRGQGDDVIGGFTVMGTYSRAAKRFKFDKQYIGQHLVIYEGTITEQPTQLLLTGQWHIPGNWSGPFELYLKYTLV